MRRSFLCGILTAALITAGPALADGLSYNYAGITLGSYNFTGMGSSITGSGFGINGSYDVGPNINLVGSYDSINYNPGTMNNFTVGGGYHMPMGGWDLITELRYRSSTLQGFPALTGYLLNVGGRVAANEQLEIRGTVGYTSLSNGGTSFTGTTVDVGAAYKVSPQIDVTADYLSDPNVVELSEYHIGARYNF